MAVPCKLSNANPGHVRLGELLECGREGWNLHFSDNDQPSLSQLESIQRQLSLHVLRTLVKRVPGFSHYKHLPDLQHTQCRDVPRGYKTTISTPGVNYRRELNQRQGHYPSKYHH